MTSIHYGVTARQLFKATVLAGMLTLSLLILHPGLAGAQSIYPYTTYGAYSTYPSYSTYPYSTYSTYPTYPTYPTYTLGNCAYLSTDLSLGSRGSDVLALQRFLVNQNYPGAGSWMLTSYFGEATQAAVRIFQANRGLPQTGIVDWQTRNAIQQYSCGTSGYQGYGTYSYPYQYSTIDQYPYSTTNQYSYQYSTAYQYPQYGYGVPLRLDSLSTQSARTGSSLTIYGAGFDRTSNTVRFGANAAVAAESLNYGTSLTVTVPSMPPGTYGIYVTNSRGVSNSLAFTVTGNPYSYYNYGGYYNYNCPDYYPYDCY